MRIDPRPTLAPTAPAAVPARGHPQQRFALDSRREPAKTAGPVSAAPLATMEALLALQGEEEPGERRRRTVQRGRDLLDGLDRLKASLLDGRVASADLRALAARLAERLQGSGDPGLDELVSYIELRAHVELAKLGMA